MTKEDKAEIGHNHGIAADRLRSIVERIEGLITDREAVSLDIREVYSEAKGAGFDAPTIREIIKIRRMDREVRQEKDALRELYREVLGL